MLTPLQVQEGLYFLWAHLDLAYARRLPVSSLRPGSARWRRASLCAFRRFRGARATLQVQVVLYFLWAHLDLNQGPTDYESAALTN